MPLIFHHLHPKVCRNGSTFLICQTLCCGSQINNNSVSKQNTARWFGKNSWHWIHPRQVYTHSLSKPILPATFLKRKNYFYSPNTLKIHNVRPKFDNPYSKKSTDSREEKAKKKLRSQMHVNYDTIGSWNNKIEMEISLEESINYGTLIPQMSLDKIGIASMLGRRDYNEDRHKVLWLETNRKIIYNRKRFDINSPQLHYRI